MKKVQLLILTMFLISVTPLLVSAGDFDGSAPLLCAVVETFDCAENSDCQQGTAHSIDIPQFLRVNFKTKTIVGDRVGEKTRSAKIDNMEYLNKRLILQGTQNGRGWSIVITETGNMTITASDDQVGFVVFGACTSQ